MPLIDPEVLTDRSFLCRAVIRTEYDYSQRETDHGERLAEPWHRPVYCGEQATYVIEGTPDWLHNRAYTNGEALIAAGVPHRTDMHVCERHRVMCDDCDTEGDVTEESQRISRNIGRNICHSCTDCYRSCSECGTIEHEDSIYYSDYTDDSYCGSCFEEVESRRESAEEEDRPVGVHSHGYKPTPIPRIDTSSDCLVSDNKAIVNALRHYVPDRFFSNIVSLKDSLDVGYYEYGYSEKITCVSGESENKGAFENILVNLNNTGWDPRVNNFLMLSKNLLLGLELEMEAEDAESLWDVCQHIHDNYGDGKHISQQLVYLKQDGSLSDDCGVEMCFHPMTLSAFKKFVPSTLFKFLINHGVRSWDAYSECGIHVHVSKAGFMGESHMYKFAQFINSNETNNFAVAGRKRSQWAIYPNNFDELPILKNIKGDVFPANRYMAVNLQPVRTIEIRIFKGSLRYERILATLEFVTAVAEYTKNITTRQIYEGGAWDWQPFREFVARNLATYGNLGAYLKLSNKPINEKEKAI